MVLLENLSPFSAPVPWRGEKPLSHFSRHFQTDRAFFSAQSSGGTVPCQATVPGVAYCVGRVLFWKDSELTGPVSSLLSWWFLVVFWGLFYLFSFIFWSEAHGVFSACLLPMKSLDLTGWSSSSSPERLILYAGDIWQCAETLLVVTTGSRRS